MDLVLRQQYFIFHRVLKYFSYLGGCANHCEAFMRKAESYNIPCFVCDFPALDGGPCIMYVVRHSCGTPL